MIRRATLGLAALLALAACESEPLPPPPHSEAVVEAVSGAVAQVLPPYSVLEAGQSIELGADDGLVLTYLANCRRETILGGRVTVGAGASTLSGGAKLLSVDQPPCRTSGVQLTVDGRKGGRAHLNAPPVTVVRDSQPELRWEGGPGTIRVWDQSGPFPRQVWEGAPRHPPAAYPPDAPLLRPGIRYTAQAVLPDGTIRAADFQIDPGLGVNPSWAGAVELR